MDTQLLIISPPSAGGQLADALVPHDVRSVGGAEIAARADGVN
jgi:hypothetical protein